MIGVASCENLLLPSKAEKQMTEIKFCLMNVSSTSIIKIQNTNVTFNLLLVELMGTLLIETFSCLLAFLVPFEPWMIPLMLE